MLELCDSQNAWLSDGIKRAIFWYASPSSFEFVIDIPV